MTERKKKLPKMTKARVKATLKKAVVILKEIKRGQEPHTKPLPEHANLIAAPKAMDLLEAAEPTVFTMWQPFCDTEQKPFGDSSSSFPVADQACSDHMLQHPGHVAEPIGSK